MVLYYSQFLNWHIVAAALSGVFAITAGVTYIKDIVEGGDTKPNAVSFFLWTLLQSVALIAQFKEGASLSAVLMVLVTLNTAAITVFALIGYGYRKYGWIDLGCFILAIAAIAALLKNPVNAILLAIVGDLLAVIPTVIKTYREPRSEHLLSWTLITVASVFGVLSSNRLDVANLAFPAYLVISNGTILALAYLGWKR